MGAVGMTDATAISWADSTFNPWQGCTKVSPACDNCYAEALNLRFADGVNWGPGAPRKRTSIANWAKPVSWNRNAAKFAAEHGRRRRVFCASMADVFDNKVDPQWRADLFELIDATPDLDWLLLTKRIGNVDKMLRAMGRTRLPDQVWIGATICNQDEAERDILKLLAIPARIRFLSCEPLLGPLDIGYYLQPTMPQLGGNTYGSGAPVELERIHWVLCGGESGPKARSMPLAWARALRRQCQEAGAAFHMKQLSQADNPRTYASFQAFPEHIRIREFPA
jgi:protein gp37